MSEPIADREKRKSKKSKKRDEEPSTNQSNNHPNDPQTTTYGSYQTILSPTNQSNNQTINQTTNQTVHQTNSQSKLVAAYLVDLYELIPNNQSNNQTINQTAFQSKGLGPKGLALIQSIDHTYSLLTYSANQSSQSNSQINQTYEMIQPIYVDYQFEILPDKWARFAIYQSNNQTRFFTCKFQSIDQSMSFARSVVLIKDSINSFDYTKGVTDRRLVWQDLSVRSIEPSSNQSNNQTINQSNSGSPNHAHFGDSIKIKYSIYLIGSDETNNQSNNQTANEPSMNQPINQTNLKIGKLLLQKESKRFVLGSNFFPSPLEEALHFFCKKGVRFLVLSPLMIDVDTVFDFGPWVTPGSTLGMEVTLTSLHVGDRTAFEHMNEQAINKTINQSNKQTTNQSASQTSNESLIHQSTDHHDDHLKDRMKTLAIAAQAPALPSHQAVVQSNNQTHHQPNNQSNNQSNNQTNNQNHYQPNTQHHAQSHITSNNQSNNHHFAGNQAHTQSHTQSNNQFHSQSNNQSNNQSNSQSKPDPALDQLLSSLSMREFLPNFEREHVRYEDLFLLINEAEMTTLVPPIGPRKRLIAKLIDLKESNNPSNNQTNNQSNNPWNNPSLKVATGLGRSASFGSPKKYDVEPSHYQTNNQSNNHAEDLARHEREMLAARAIEKLREKEKEIKEKELEIKQREKAREMEKARENEQKAREMELKARELEKEKHEMKTYQLEKARESEKAREKSIYQRGYEDGKEEALQLARDRVSEMKDSANVRFASLQQQLTESEHKYETDIQKARDIIQTLRSEAVKLRGTISHLEQQIKSNQSNNQSNNQTNRHQLIDTMKQSMDECFRQAADRIDRKQLYEGNQILDIVKKILKTISTQVDQFDSEDVEEEQVID